ncbi:hypothetical protein GVAV_000021 [Gurleya vavrai]
MQHETNNNNKACYDLASAVNATKEFSGLDQEDVFTWEKEINMLKDLFALDKPTTKKLIFCKLKGKAQTWLAQLMSDKPWLEGDEIMKLLKKQFSNTEKNHKQLNQFLQIKQVKNKIEYFELIEIANELYEKNSISEYNLIKLTISRCPANIRPLLVKFTLNDGEWFNFIREAKENAWIAFTEENNQIHGKNILNEDVFAIKKFSGKFQKKWNNKNRSKYCKLHGQANHTTADCTLLTQLKNRKMKLVSDNEINEIIKKETDDENENDHDLNEFINKNNFIYF